MTKYNENQIEKMSFLIRKMKIQYKILLIIVFLSTLGVVIGLFIEKKDVGKKKKISEPNEIYVSDSNEVSVKVRKNNAEEKVVYLSTLGTTDPLYINILPEVNGKVEKVFTDSGKQISIGEPIVKIEDYNYLEQLEQAKALVKQRQLEYQAAKSLTSQGYRSQTQVTGSFTALKAAEAELKRSQVNVNNTLIKSPISGYIDKINVQKGDVVSNNFNQVIAKIVNFDKIKILTYVSEKDVNKIKIDSVVQIKLMDEKEYSGRVNFISKIINPSTKTYRLDILIDDPGENFINQGMSCEVKIPIKLVKAHKIPASALNLTDDGILGIKVVDEDRIVSFIPVELIDGEEDEIWVTGAPDIINLIVLGQMYVNPGDKVTF